MSYGQTEYTFFPAIQTSILPTLGVVSLLSSSLMAFSYYTSGKNFAAEVVYALAASVLFGVAVTPLTKPNKPKEDALRITPFGYSNEHLSSDLLKNVITTINNHPDSLVLTRVGGFYEAYYDHALDLSKLLSFSVGEKSYNKTRFPMAGFPSYQLQKHLRTLVVDHSLFVAINDQFFNHATGAFDRKVTRVITPGTLIDESSLNPSTHNFLVSVVLHGDCVGLAWSDISTGDSYAESCIPSDLKSFIARLSPSEIVFDIQLTSAQTQTLHSLLGAHDSIITHAHISSQPPSPLYTPIENAAISLLQSRIQASLIENTPSITPTKETDSHKLILDAQTIRGLELKSTIRENRASGSLVKAVRRTSTQQGNRLLERWLCEPSSDIAVITARHDCVALLTSRKHLRRHLRAMLRDIEDGPRLLQRVLLGASYKPSLLLSVKRVMENSHNVVSAILAEYDHERDSNEDLTAHQGEWQSLLTLSNSLRPLIKFAQRIDSVIIEDALRAKDDESEDVEESEGESSETSETTDTRKSNTQTYNDDYKRSITPQHSPAIAKLNKKLDKLYEQRNKFVSTVMQDLKATDASHVALRSNQKLGHYITARKSSVKALPTAYQIVASQKSTASYSHPQWTAIKSAIMDTSDELERAERDALTSLKDELAAESEAFRHNNHLIAQLDVLTSFAEMADEKHWVRPTMTTERCLHVTDGRHPAVEMALHDSLNSFTPNDVNMDRNAYINTIFGPNMGGKSTYLRQNAIIVIMAQAGSFVPARAATIGLVDRVFSRIGASDDLSGGRSTFMVEMSEAAEILQNATPSSLVIMDEIGRGTTSLDGLSLAYAILLHLAQENKSRTFFATHFHELEDMLSGDLPIKHLSTDLVEKDGAFSFTYKLRDGVCRDSHGIVVARLAGIPTQCIEKAQHANSVLTPHNMHSSDALRVLKNA